MPLHWGYLVKSHFINNGGFIDLAPAYWPFPDKIVNENYCCERALRFAWAIVKHCGDYSEKIRLHVSGLTLEASLYDAQSI